MFEEKREAVMAIEAAVLPFGAILNVRSRSSYGLNADLA
jgi:hypothetical protein